MTSLLTSLYLLSFKETEVSHTADVDCIPVSQKVTCTRAQYGQEKKDFFQSRTEKHKKNWNWKRNAKVLDKLFRSYASIFLSWEFNQPLKIFFSNGSIALIELNCENNAVEKVEIFSNLIGKLIQSRIVDAVIAKNSIYVTYCEPKLTRIDIDQESSFFRIFGIKKGFEPKISHIDLVGPCNKSVERRISLNYSKDWLLIWWKFNCDDVWPWTPVSYSADRINMVVYSINDGFDALCSVRANGELIQARFSQQCSNQIFTLERVRSEPKDGINVCVYEVIENYCQHAFLYKLPLRGDFLTCDWSSNDKLLISDSDHLLLIYDLMKKTSFVTNLSFLPKQIAWHPQNCIALVIGSNNQLQCFDAALTCVKFKMFYKSHTETNMLNIDSYISRCSLVQRALWQKSNHCNSCIFLLDPDLSSFLILKFCSGVMTQNLGVVEFISQYLKSNLIDEAILLLRSLNWCYESELCFYCLSKLANCLFRRPYNAQNQAGLELALGTFYDNIDNLSKHVVRHYQHKIHHLTRRFFHYLLRHQQLRKAFLLAVDLESQDLFLDIYNTAKLKGENILAMVALHKAEEFDASSDSYSSSYSSDDSKSATSSDNESVNYSYSDVHSVSGSNSYDHRPNQKYNLRAATQSYPKEDWLNHSGETYKIKSDNSESTYKFPSCSNFSEPLSCYLSPSKINSETFHELSNISTSSAKPVCSAGSLSRSSPHQTDILPKISSLQINSNVFYESDKSSELTRLETTFSPTEIDLSSCQKNLRCYSASSARPLPEYPPLSSRNFSGSIPIQSVNSGSKSSVNKYNHLREPRENLSLSKNVFCEDDVEELEDAKIKLVHFGII